jgi:hypothetical protein
MYALAASAAGVSLLASVPPIEAEIIYTKAHLRKSPLDSPVRGNG